MANVILNRNLLIKRVEHIYKLTDEKKTTRHYILKEVSGGAQMLTDKIRLSINRRFNNSHHVYLMHERTGPKRYNKQITTGLMPTEDKNIFEGDIRNQYKQKDHKVMFVFDEQILRVIVFPNYFTSWTH